MERRGKKVRRVQAYKCANGHTFRVGSGLSWSDSFIEYAVFVYLRCLSLNTTVDIIRATYDEEILSKPQVLEFVEWVADALPALDEVDAWYQPHRSGYLAFDGVWFKYAGEQIVLLVSFDTVSFDVVAAIWERGETSAGYTRLINQVLAKLPKGRIKGVYGDGDNGLILSLKTKLPQVPFQLCVVHKNFRMSQTVPVHSAQRSQRFTPETRAEILKYAELFQATLYADSKEKATAALRDLLVWTSDHPREKFVKAVAALRHNFAYTLTHFDHPGMERDNNLLECFNGILKPRLRLMKGFKKADNLDRYLKLFLLDFRFHHLKESRLDWRRDASPIQLGGVLLPDYHNFLAFLRTQFHLVYQPKSP